ncbi:penicillin acylase family protein [Tumebacillus permanentifrigoris]|uniref:Penicillin amidase n=1 Tax=Tumebacillus permanentifrigoris TaxID=378543 RepID=A0A316DFS6_9BACL|nr:penicillin acylase family protein [Tumebacillus permanentifrigoris]PWK16402.1 penicillin amidase [Tumebacillus permanentifrigoris]
MSTYTKVTVQGLQHAAQIVFQPDGTPHVKAHNDADAYYCVGYLHAKYRLFQIDFIRRQGHGRLAEVVGPTLLESDKYQRELNLSRLVDGEWKLIQAVPETRAVIEAYTAGVNSVIDEYRASGQWPFFFQQLGYTPEPWTPQDTLMSNAVMSQLLSSTEIPVLYSMIADKLGEDKLSKLFPVLPNNEQNPYDRGPYRKLPPQPFPISPEQYFREFHAHANASVEDLVAATEATVDREAGLDFLARFNQIPTHNQRDRHSNAWVVSGEKSTTGKAMLAADPHLVLNLPSIWYQVHIETPQFDITGVTVPGNPFVFIGRNQHLAWGVTSGQNASNFFYKEHTDEAHPNQYLWDGAWHEFFTTTTEIKVRGAETVEHTYQSSVHGPIIMRGDAPYALTWVYGVPGRGATAYHKATQAKSFDQFKAAIRLAENSPLNWCCADDQNNIGIISGGRLAMFREGVKPWLPMTGTGEADIIGLVPKEAMPLAHNPEQHYLSTSNQRQAGPDYPYYLGTATNFDPGYRANRAHQLLAAKDKFSPEDFVAMQFDVTDCLAAKIVPVLLNTMQGQVSGDLEIQALRVLSSWDYQMLATEVGPTLWWEFWSSYLQETFDPWMNLAGLPVKEYNASPIEYLNSALDQNLEHWTLADPTNEFFTNPQTGVARTAPEVMVAAFHKMVNTLQEKLGTDVDTWTWGSVHNRLIASLIGEPSLSYGPVPCDGDTFTLNVSPGMTATFGASWRMVTVLDKHYTGAGIYPGGQSEDPTSGWYTDRLAGWATGNYAKFVSFHDAEKDPQNTQRWELQPAKHQG